MKAGNIILGLSISAFFILYLNGDVMAEHLNKNQKSKKHIKITDKRNGKLINEVTKQHHKNKKVQNKNTGIKLKDVNKNLHKSGKHFLKSSKKHLQLKQLSEPTTLKLSPQMAAAKKVCYNMHNIDHKILNATRPEQNSLPWMAAIFKEIHELYNDTQFICAGSLISSQFVLTAAHCFIDAIKKWSVEKYSMLSVHLGIHDLSSANFFLSGVIKIYVPPDYTSNRLQLSSDIALVKLSNTVTYNDVIHPICIPHLTTPSAWNKWENVKSVLIAGWGSTTPYNGSSLLLQKGYASLLHNDVCQKYTSWIKKPTIICIGKRSNESKFCTGDDGSPAIPLTFMSHNASMVFPVIIGIFSFGGPYCSGLDILTNVESFIDWINYWTS